MNVWEGVMWPEDDMSYVRRALPALWWKERGLAAHKADMLNKGRYDLENLEVVFEGHA